MANTKKRKKRRKKSAVNTKMLTAAVIILVILAVVLLVCIFFNQIVQKVKEFSPNNFTYPTKYEEYVIEYSNEFDMDPRFVFAIINTESHFDPRATSEVGARGLMQLMDEAYNWVKYRLDDQESKSFDDMYDPKTNIKYGTYMLKYLYDKYDGSYQLTAAAYHGGMGAVDGWIEDGLIDPEDFKLEDVPSDVTANYIYKVMKAYNKYKEKLPQEGKTNGQEN